VKRREFLRAAAAAAALPLAGAAPTPASLRVFLGRGEASASGAGTFRFEGRTYRGTFSRGTDGNVVNTVGLEEYLYSVVPREMPSVWPARALQMQAICARSFVLQHADPRRAYDVVPSHLAQVYQGVSAETAAGRDAVEATAGMVLRFAGEIAQAEYSACCGGRTESASDAWGGPGVPYLRSVRCPYCTASPDYRWSQDVALETIARAFERRLQNAGELRDVRLGPPDSSGRARSVTLVAQRGALTLRGSEFRLGVGPALVRSLMLFDASAGAETLHIVGGGNGHGVGLCQWGAREIAALGGSVEQIAWFYFPSTSIDRWTNVSSRRTTTSFRSV
jgi:stage II sporulation protein D